MLQYCEHHKHIKYADLLKTYHSTINSINLAILANMSTGKGKEKKSDVP